MRILMFGWELPPHNSGGLGVACYGLVRALSEEGNEVIFVLPRKVDVPHDLPNIRFAKGDQIQLKEIDTLLRPYVTSGEYDRYRRTLRTDIYGPNLFSEVLRYAYAAEVLAREEVFDIIHAHDWLSFLAGIRVKRLTGKPLVVHVHATGYELSGDRYVDDRIYAIEREGMREADCVITVSHRTKRIVRDVYGIDERKIEVIHNGTIPAECDYGSADDWEHSKQRLRESVLPVIAQGWKMVLYAGRLTLHKGPDHFLRAARKVLEYEPNTLFVIAGSGDMEGQIIRQAAGLGMADRVFFAGFVRGKQMQELYHAADLYVLPSVSEPFGLAPLESLSNGTPVLISKQAGVAEVLRNTLKVDFWDTEEMAHKILMALRHPVLTRQLARYGYLESFAMTWQKAALKCTDLYRRLLAT